MDKYEYKIRSEEIKSLIAKEEYAEAAAIADSIDWRRVKSIMMLCTISDLYKINRRLEDAREMLLLAYDRHPGGRSIVYSLCEISIKLGDVVEAMRYYREFVQVAPKDSGRYVLKYKLYEAQEGVTLEERIEVLEELKGKDYSEKWAYELAYLYHRVGLETKCVEECDELILWFGDGKYVRKALELKQLHEPLTPEQQDKYERIKAGVEMSVQPVPEDAAGGEEEPDLMDAPTREIPQKELDIQVKVMNVGQYDTINMQRALAENMKEIWEDAGEQAESRIQPDENFANSEPESGDTGMFDLPDEEEEDIEEGESEEFFETRVEEVFFGETGEMDAAGTQVLEEMKREMREEIPAEVPADAEAVEEPIEESMEELEETEQPTVKESVPVVPESIAAPASQPQAEDGAKAPIINFYAGKPSKFDNMLGMEYDGQLSMVVPDSEQVEKQITGQLQLEDVLLEWEKIKKDNEQKRMEAVRQHVLEQTGSMFTEFDAAARDGLLEQLEKSGIDEEAEDGVSGELEVLEGEELPEEAAEILDESVDTEIEEELEEIAEESAEEAEEDEETAEASEEGEAAQETEAEEAEGEYAESEENAEAEEGSESENAEENAEESEEAESAEEAEKDEEAAEASEEAETAQESEAEENAEEAEEKKETAESSDEAESVQKDDTAKEKQSAPNKETEGDKGSKVRELSPEEQQIFGAYTQNRKTREQIVHAIDHVSMAAYTGNVIITGEEGADTLTLAKNLIKEIQQTDSNFSGKIAKISGDSLNKKELAPILDKLKNGALIVQSSGEMNEETVGRLRNALEQENNGLIILLEDTKKSINKLLKTNSGLTECFNIRIDIEALDNDSLVEYGKKYAREQEYSIDDFGMLALHTRIAERQTSDHAVTIAEVKELVDNAIDHANRKSLNHFIDILVAKRYDEEDMIILREKDFM